MPGGWFLLLGRYSIIVNQYIGTNGHINSKSDEIAAGITPET